MGVYEIPVAEPDALRGAGHAAMPLDHGASVVVPGAVAAGGLATVLAALGLRRGGGAGARDDEAVTDGGDPR